jgi:acyl carrier protein
MDMKQSLKEYIVGTTTAPLPENFDTSVNMIDAGIMDSLSMMNVIIHLEQQYKIEVSMTEMTPDNFESIDALAKFIQNKQRRLSVALVDGGTF